MFQGGFRFGILFAIFSRCMADLLVVDDDPDVAEPLILFLNLQGHRVRYAEDGLAALKAVTEYFPDLILLDIEMPRLTGPEMAYRLLIEDCGRENIPLVVLSGVTDLPSVAGRIGTPYYLSKPFTFEAMQCLLDLALHERTLPGPRASTMKNKFQNREIFKH
jgi:CheY-like chemotaxis protein